MIGCSGSCGSKRSNHADWRHPAEIGGAEINRYLTHFAVNQKVSASTQNQALSALLFVFREVLQKESLKMDAVRAKKPERLPVLGEVVN